MGFWMMSAETDNAQTCSAPEVGAPMVNVTEKAAKEIADIIQKEAARDESLQADSLCLRVGVKGGGCSGFNYLLDLTPEGRGTDWYPRYSY